MTRVVAPLALLCAFLSACGPADRCSDQPGSTCVWAGTGELGFNGDGKHRLETRFYWTADMEFDASNTPWLLDWNNHMVRRVVDDKFETMIGSFVGDGPPDQSDMTAPGAPGLEVALNHPTDMQFDKDGALILVSWHNHKLRRYDPSTGMVTVIAGRGADYAGDNGPFASALLNQPKGLVIQDDGNWFILDQRNHRVRKVAADSTRTITTIAGTGVAGFGGDGELATACQLKFEAGGNPEPSGAIASDGKGTLYIADSLNHRIRKLDLATGVISSLAGTGEAGFSGDGGPALQAQLNNPRDLELGPDGRLYVADTENHRIRVIDVSTGTIETFAGNGETGTVGDADSPTGINLNRPFGIAFDRDGHLFISDTFNSRIIKVVR